MQPFESKYYKRTGKILFPVLLFLSLFLEQSSVAQQQEIGIHELGLGIGGFNYTGEINPRYDFMNYRPGGMAFYRYNSLNRVTSFRFGFSFGLLAGTESRSREYTAEVRSASFKSNITEFSLMGEYNFINYRDKKQLWKFSPYLTAGFALFSSLPKTKSNSNVETEDQTLNPAIPFGFGVKFMLNRNWNLGTEFIARKTFTDYLDGLSNADIATRSTGNPLDNDWYFYTGINLSYTFYKTSCPQEYKY
jgi:hypothetical protein